MTPVSQVYEFADFQLNGCEHSLTRRGVPVPLPGRAFDTLLVLLQRAGHLVKKSELIAIVWKDSFVEEGNLAVTISAIRKALGDDRGDHRYITTVSKQGYRFVADVKRVELKEAEDCLSEPQPQSSNPPTEAPPPADTKYWHGLTFPQQWRSVATVVSIVGIAIACLFGIEAITKPHTSASAANMRQPSPALQLLTRNTKASYASKNPQAQHLYLEGRYYLNKRTKEGMRRGAGFFEQATLIDPRFGPAFAGLSDAYSMLASNGMVSVQEGYPIAKAAAVKALQLDDSMPEAHSSLAVILFKFEWDWVKAEAEFRRAIELDPDYALTHISYANCLAAMGRFDEALKEAQRAEQLDPVSVGANTEIGRVYYLSRRYDQAVVALQHAIDLDPFYPRTHTRLALVYSAMGDYASAMRELNDASRLSGTDPYLDGYTGYVEARRGNTQRARTLLASLTERSRQEYVPAFSMALICVGLDDREEALTWLAKAYKDRSEVLIYSKVDPIFDAERSDHRFVSFLIGMRLSPGTTRDQSVALVSSPANEPFALVP